MNKQPAWFAPPRTKLGRWSLKLMGAFLALFGAWWLWLAITDMSRPTFWSDPVHAVLIICAGAAGSASGWTGVCAVLLKRERSLLVLATTAIGCFIAWWTYMEIFHQP